jgi:hypothetical protein
MATRRATVDAEVNSWAIVGREGEGDDEIVTWENPASGESVNLSANLKPTPAILKSLAANGNGPRKIDVEPDGLFPEQSLENEPDNALSRVLEGLNVPADGGKPPELKVYRIRDGQKEIYCATFTPEDFENNGLETIRQSFGGGKYRIIVYGIKPGGNKWARLANVVEEIESSIAPLKSDTNSPQAGIPQVMEMMMRRFELLENRIATGGAGGGQSLADQIDMLVKLQTAFGGNKSGGGETSMAKMVENMRALRSLENELSGGKKADDAEPSMLGMGMELLSTLKTLAPSQQSIAPVAVPPGLTQPLPLPAMPNKQTPESIRQTEKAVAAIAADNGDSESAAQQLMLKTMLDALITKASEKADVFPIAADLYIHLPDEALTMLESMLWFEMLTKFQPEIANHKEWFTALRTAIMAEITADEAAEHSGDQAHLS